MVGDGQAERLVVSMQAPECVFRLLCSFNAGRQTKGTSHPIPSSHVAPILNMRGERCGVGGSLGQHTASMPASVRDRVRSAQA